MSPNIYLPIFISKLTYEVNFQSVRTNTCLFPRAWASLERRRLKNQTSRRWAHSRWTSIVSFGSTGNSPNEPYPLVSPLSSKWLPNPPVHSPPWKAYITRLSLLFLWLVTRNEAFNGEAAGPVHRSRWIGVQFAAKNPHLPRNMTSSWSVLKTPLSLFMAVKQL